MIKLELTRKRPKPLTVRFVVESFEVVDGVLSFWQNGLKHRYHLDNYSFTIDSNNKK